MSDLSNIFSSLADAIRSKIGTSIRISPVNMANYVQNLVAYSPVNADSVATAELPSPVTSLSYDGNLHAFFRDGVNFGLTNLSIDWSRVVNVTNLFENSYSNDLLPVFYNLCNATPLTNDFSYLFVNCNFAQASLLSLQIPSYVNESRGLFFGAYSPTLNNFNFGAGIANLKEYFSWANNLVLRNTVIPAVNDYSYMFAEARFTLYPDSSFSLKEQANLAYTFAGARITVPNTENSSSQNHLQLPFTNISNAQHMFDHVLHPMIHFNFNSLAPDCDASYIFANVFMQQDFTLHDTIMHFSNNGYEISSQANLSYCFYNDTWSLNRGSSCTLVFTSCNTIKYALSRASFRNWNNCSIVNCNDASWIAADSFHDWNYSLKRTVGLPGVWNFTNVNNISHAFSNLSANSDITLTISNCGDISDLFSSMRYFATNLHLTDCTVRDAVRAFYNIKNLRFPTRPFKVTGNADYMLWNSGDRYHTLNSLEFDGVPSAVSALENFQCVNNVIWRNLPSVEGMENTFRNCNLLGNLHISNMYNLSDTTNSIINAFANGWVSGNNFLHKIINDLW